MSTFISNLCEKIPGMATYRGQGSFERFLNFVSPGILGITGYTPQELVEGKIYLEKLIHPDDFLMVSAQVQWALSENKSYQVDYRLVGKDGRIRWVMDQGFPIPIQNQNQNQNQNQEQEQEQENHRNDRPCFEGLLIDITHRKMVEIELQNQVKDHEESVAKWSHELRNPIAAMMLQTTLLEMDLKKSKIQSDFSPMLGRMLEIAKRQLSRLNQLVDSIKVEHQELERSEGVEEVLKKEVRSE